MGSGLCQDLLGEQIRGSTVRLVNQLPDDGDTDLICTHSPVTTGALVLGPLRPRECMASGVLGPVRYFDHEAHST
jgi:hypothetical protein